MAQYLSPGVYVEEVDAGPKPIEGVSTSVAGAVGVTARGPDSGKPVLVTSFADYVRIFGAEVEPDQVVKSAWSDDPEKGEFWTFPLSVRGFFDNGGQQLYVKRVLAQSAQPARAALGKGVMAFITKNTVAGATTLKLDSLIGVSTGTTLNVSVDGVFTTVTVSAYDAASSTVTVAPAIATRAVANRDFVQVGTSTTGASVTLAASSAGEWGDAISVRVRPMDAGTFAVMADPAATNGPATTSIAADAIDTKFTVASATGFANNDWVIIDGRQYQIQVAGTTFTVSLPLGNPSWAANSTIIKGTDPAGTTTTTVATTASGATFDVADGTAFTPGTVLNTGGTDLFVVTTQAANTLTVMRVKKWNKNWSVIRVRLGVAVANATPTLSIWNASSLYPNAFVEVEDTTSGVKYYGTITSITGHKVALSLDGTITAFNILEGQRLRLIEGQVEVVYQPANGPAVAELIQNVRFKEAEAGDPMYITKRLENESNLVRDSGLTAISISSLGDFPLAVVDNTVTNPIARTWTALAGGDDAFGALDADDFVGLDLGPGHRSGIQALEDIDDISITMAPSITSSLVQNALIQQAELLKYRFAILDPRPVKPTDTDVIDEIRTFRAGFDTKYAALYFPRIEVRDPYIDDTVALGPSGHMAGLYARVDIERGVHKAPANEVIFGIDTANGFHGLEVEVTKREQDLLNPIGINALRFFPNRGTRVWGARTLSSDGAWKYVNVRRIFIYVEHSIDIGTQWVVFEPNDEKTWARVRQSITNFLTTTWRSGALFGTKAEEAFFVRCDRTTMTQDDIDNGRLICVIGIAPVKPAEFVIFRIQQKLIDQTQP